jgi:uncharacterized protein
LPTRELNSDGNGSQVAIKFSSSGCDICSDYLASIVTKYSEKILLTESDTKPRSTRRKEKKKLPTNASCKDKVDISTEWQGPPPWDHSIGGDGYPKFLCDVMVGRPDYIKTHSYFLFSYHSAMNKMNLGVISAV